MRFSKNWLTALTVLSMLPLVEGCSNMRHFEWTEDVQLSDGRIIVVQRSEDRRRIVSPGDGFKEGWLFQRASIKAALPSPIDRTMIWEGSLSPLALGIQDDGAVYLVCIVPTRAAELEWKVSRYDFYVIFRLIKDAWQRISIAELPASIQPNLLSGVYDFIERGAHSGIHIDLKQKGELTARLRASDPRRTIIRAPHPN